MTDKEKSEVSIRTFQMLLARLYNKQLIVKSENGEYRVPTNDLKFHLEVAREEDGLIIFRNRSESLFETGLFFQVQFVSSSAIHSLLSKGLSVYCRDEYNPPYFCKLSDIRQVLSNFSKEISFIELPLNFTLSSDLTDCYFDIYSALVKSLLERYEKGYRIHNIYRIKKYGIFGFNNIYTSIEWNFDLVEKYKDELDWKSLIEKSNLKWDESKVLHYLEFIPFCNIAANTYCSKFDRETTIGNYSNIYVSKGFIKKHSNLFEWNSLLKTGNLDWEEDDYMYFYQISQKETLPWSDSFPDTPAKSQLFYRISTNNSFAWTIRMVRSFAEKAPRFLDEIQDLPIFERSCLIEKILEDKGLVDLLKEKQEFDIIAEGICNPILSVDNIEKNKEEWSKAIGTELDYIQRTSDTNYHYTKVITTWDNIAKNPYVYLTYELCKYLKDKTIIIGGIVETIDSEWCSPDKYIFEPIHALSLFSNKKIVNEQNLEMIFEDKDLLIYMIECGNICVIDHFIDNFFADYSISNYLEIINPIVKAFNWYDNN